MLVWAAQSRLEAATAVDPPDQPEVTCESRIFLYIDRSRSLGSVERSDLAKELSRVLRSSEVKYITNNKLITMIPFGARLPEEDKSIGKVVDEAALERQIDAAFKGNKAEDEAIDAEQSNFEEVLIDINRKILDLGEWKANTAFIIASDFEHDQTVGEDDSSSEEDEAGWNDLKEKLLWKDLTKAFGDSDAGGPLLLLLPVRRASDFGRQVLLDLDELTDYNSQIGSTRLAKIDLSSVIRFLDPVKLANHVERRRDGRYLISTARIRSCTSALQVEVIAKVVKGPDLNAREPAIKEVSPGQEPPAVWEFPLNSLAGSHALLPDIAIRARLHLGGKVLPFGSPQGIDIDEYVALTRFVGEPNRKFNQVAGKVTFERGLLSRETDVVLRLLNDRESEIGRGKISLSMNSSTEREKVPAEFAIDISDPDVNLASICFQERQGDGRHALLLSVETPRGVTAIPVDAFGLIAENGEDWDDDTLKDLAEKGSVPAFLTLGFLISMIARRSHLTLGNIEEMLAVAGLFGITIFVLAHRVGYVGKRIDLLFEAGNANYLGAVICFLLGAAILMIGVKGALFPGKEGAEIDADIERCLASRTEGGRSKSRQERWRLAFIIMIAFMPLVVGGLLLADKPKRQCAFVPSQDLADPAPAASRR